MTGVLLAVCGALVGFGVWIAVATVARWPFPVVPVARVVAGRNGGRSPRRVAFALAAGVLVLVVTRWPVAAVGTAVGGAVFGGRFGSMAAGKALTARSEAVAAWAETVRDTIVAGAGLPQALVTSTRVAPPALTDELRRLAERVDAVGVQRALAAFAVEVAHPAADVLVVALVTADRHGTADLVALITAQVEATMFAESMT